MSRVFVAGATGVIGARVVPLLLRAGHAVAGMTRSAHNAAALQALGAEGARIAGTWHWDAATKQVVVDLTQNQPGDLHSLPIDIGITLANGTTRVEHAELTTASGHYTFAATEEPASVVIDPNVRLLVSATMERRQP
jgi:nucleoside-diphosphate-sugar epimerase